MMPNVMYKPAKVWAYSEYEISIIHGIDVASIPVTCTDVIVPHIRTVCSLKSKWYSCLLYTSPSP